LKTTALRGLTFYRQGLLVENLNFKRLFMKIPVTQTLSKASTFPRLLLKKSKFIGLLVWILFFVVYGHAQNITVKGRVTTETGQGVPNASVTIKGTTTGVSSNSTGAFEIVTPPNATLVISSVGFGTKEVNVNGQQSIDVSLGASGNDLDQVVVD
jgi:uncharacterized membrane protein